MQVQHQYALTASFMKIEFENLIRINISTVLSQICSTVGPSLAASLEPLDHCRNVASLSLFYRYYFGRCSSELAQLVPLPFSRGRSTRYSDRLHDFSVTIRRCYKDVYVNSFFPGTATYKMLSFDL